MPLDKQRVPINLTGGLDLGGDSKLLVPGKLTTLDNGEFESSKTIKKRGGYATLAANVASPQLVTKTRDELVAVSRSPARLESYAQGSATWISRGLLPHTFVTTKQIVRNTAAQTGFDCMNAGGVTVYAWEDSRGGVRVSVFDATSGVAYQNDVLIGTGFSRPKLVTWTSGDETYFGLFVAKLATTELYSYMMNAGAPATAFALADDSISDLHADCVFDVAATGNTTVPFVVAYKESAGGTLTLVGRLNDLTHDWAQTTAAIVTVLAVSVFGTGEVAVFYWSAGYDLRYVVMDATGILYGPTVVEALAAPGPYRITCAYVASTQLRVVYEVLPAGAAVATYNHSIRHAVVNRNGTVATAAALVARSVGLASAPFTLDGALHVAAVHESTLQPTLFVIGIGTNAAAGNGVVKARALPWRSAGLPTTYRVPQTFTLNSVVSVPAGEIGRLSASAGTLTTRKGISQVDVIPGDAGWKNSVEFNDSLYFPGSAPQLFDGVSVVEEGFHLYPENFTASVVGSGSLPDGSYQHTVVWEWTDGKGRLHRSAAGVPITTVISGGGGVKMFQLTVPTLRLTRRTSPRSEVTLAVYRTENAGTIFYRTAAVSSATLNDPTADTVTLTDNTTDAALVGNELLYTTGGALDNDPCPPCHGFAVHQRRLWAVGLENPYQFAYSKQAREGESAGFSELLVGDVPPDYGRLSGAGVLDDKLILLTEQRPFLIYGEGPNDAGLQNGYSLPQLITAEVGCVYGAMKSIARSADGLWFLSAKGLRLLGRDLTIAKAQDGSDLGSEVDSAATACVAALVHPTKSQVWFYTGAAVLVWDSQFRQWSKFTNFTALDAAVWGSTLVHANGTIMQTGGTSDNGTNILLTVETGWLTPAGVQGYQRVYELGLLGTYSARSQMNMQVAYDFSNTYQTAVTADTSVIGGASVPVRLRYKLPIQKCEALRFKVVESAIQGVATAGGFALSNLSLLLGVKRGMFKQSATATKG